MQTAKEMLLKDLEEVFKSIVVTNNREGRKMSRKQVCKIISQSPAPRLYITPEYALRVFRNYPRCGAHTYRASAMQQELRSRILALPPDLRTTANIAKVIAQPAPSFYLSPRRIYDFLYRVYDRRE